MKFKIEPQIFGKFSEVVIGVVVVQGMDNSGTDEAITSILREQEEKVQEHFANVSSWVEIPVVAAWRGAYRKFGANPHDYRSSIEALVRRTAKGNPLPRINKVVDLYNFISLKHLAPVGGEDLDRVKGDIVLGFARGDESFVLLGDTEEKSPDPGEVIYKDDAGVLCRKWNWREGDRTKMTEDTKNAILVIEGLPPVGETEIAIAIQELSDLIKTYCGGEIVTFFLSKDNPEVEI
jgi:DNA/RNA-binding domain of Phe-tRNA-synthetase-like protein